MALRARPDNLALDHPVQGTATAPAPVADFSELWAHREALRHACYRMVGDAATAEDLVQDTYVRALKSGARLDRTQSTAPWLATVARRRSIDELRARRWLATVDRLPEPEAAGHHADDPAQQVLNQERVERVRAALAELGPRERQLLLRQVSHGISLADLAAEECTSVASVRSVLARARQKLRMALERGGALGAAPLPRLVASWRHRWQRWAMRAEGSLPVLVGGGWQIGQVVVAVLAALASLLGSAVPDPQPLATELASVAGPVGGRVEQSGVRAAVQAEAGDPATTATTSVTAAAGPPREAEPSVMPAVSLDLPPVPDRADQPEQSYIRSVSASPDGSVVFASGSPNTGGVREGLYRSGDGGHTWQRRTATGYLGGRILFPPSYPADPRIFAGGTHLQVSHDDGNSFTLAAPLRGEAVIPPDFAATSDIFVAGPPPARYNAAFPVVAPMMMDPPSLNAGGIDTGPSYATTGQLLVGATATDAGGVNQASLFSCDKVRCTRVAGFPGLSVAPTVIVSDTSPNVVYLRMGKRAFRSVDGGTTFSGMTFPAGFTLEAMHEGRGGALFAAGRNTGGTGTSGLLVSADHGSSWTALGASSTVGSAAYGVVELAGGRLVVTLSTAGLLCSADGGATWAPRCPAPTVN